MKGYGLPRHLNVEYPDKADIRYYGLAPTCHGEKVKSVKKRAARRYWKKRDRMINKTNLNNALVAQLAEATV